MIIKAIAQEEDQKERNPEFLLRLDRKRFFTPALFALPKLNFEILYLCPNVTKREGVKESATLYTHTHTFF